jgi:hypothetical protein
MHTPEPAANDHDADRNRQRINTVINYATSVAFHVGILLVFMMILLPPLGRQQQEDPPKPAHVLEGHKVSITPAPPPKGEHHDAERRRPVKRVESRRPDFQRIATGKPPELKLDIEGESDGLPTPIAGDPHGTRFDGILYPRGARTVVFLIDKSGSMFDGMDAVRARLKRVVGRLKPFQRFELIFFNERVQNWKGRLVAGVGPRKREAFRFVDGIIAEGQTKPQEAVRRGLALRPELMFILSDGEFEAEVVDLVARLNKAKRTRIHTYAYQYDSVAVNLKRIAEQNGGQYRNIRSSDLDGPSETPRDYDEPRTPANWRMPAAVYPAVYVYPAAD